MRLSLASLVVGAALALAACTTVPQLSHYQLSVLDKGLAPAETEARLKQPPLSMHRSVEAGRSFDFHRYRLSSGAYADDYFLAFENGKLVYWGYLTDFRRQPDRELNSALSAVLREVVPTK